MTPENTLGPFPVDDLTLDALGHALNAAFTVDEDGTHHIVGAEYSMSQLMDFLSGYDSTKTIPYTDKDGYEVPDTYEYVGGPIYHPYDVIESLVNEVRKLRAEIALYKNQQT